MAENRIQNQNMNKKRIRKEVLIARNNLSLAEREGAAVLLAERICGHPWFYHAEMILAFVSYGSEIDTAKIINEALKLGKKVYVPKVQGEDMNFYRICNWSELEEGYKGILEPTGATECYAYQPREAEKVLMLMPGAVFDKNRNRIGYGKGFYDRFLSDKQKLQLRTIGVGFQCQLVEALEAEEWDIRPCQVICV